MAPKYNSLEDLVSKIQKKQNQLIEGKLDENGLNSYIEKVQELQERLVILRFKAYEEAIEHQGDNLQKPIEIQLKNQISLIDAIEEEVKKDNSDLRDQQKKPKKQAPPQVQIAIKPVVETPKPEVVAPTPKAAPVVTAKPEPTHAAPAATPSAEQTNEASLNERLSQQTSGTSLNERLKKTPISDLTKAIGINQKYLFINELFNQNADHFNQVVQELNTCENYKQALTKVRGDVVPNYKWDDEDRNVIAFMDLVERRFLN